MALQERVIHRIHRPYDYDESLWDHVPPHVPGMLTLSTWQSVLHEYGEPLGVDVDYEAAA